MKFNFFERPKEADMNLVRHRLQEHDDNYCEVKEKFKNVITLNDEDDIVGGIVFTIFGEWLEIDFFWVDTQSRCHGYGHQILNEAETYAMKKGCKNACLSTINFQAKPFYENNGYHVVYTQNNYPLTKSRYFMEKKLSQD